MMRTIHVPGFSGRYMATIPVLATVMVLLLALLPASVLAQDGGSVVGPYIVTLQPGEELEVDVHGFCLNYGLPFPGKELTPIELAAENLRNAAIFSLANRYIDSDPYGVQKAIWYLSDGTRLQGQNYLLADEIIAYADSGVQPADVVTDVPHMAEALADGTLEATVVDFVNVAPELGAFFGNGVLKISNVSDTAQQFVISYGTVVHDGAEGDQQNMLVFPTQPAPTPVPPVTGALLSPVVLALLILVGAALGLLVFGSLRRRAVRQA